MIVGAGLMGRWHAHAIHAIGQRVNTIVDDDIGRATALAEKYGAIATTNIESAFAEHPIAVHICTPPATHAKLAAKAIAAKTNVLIEKPFAPSLAETTTLLALAKAAGVIACPVHQLVFQRGTRAALDRLAEFGPLLHADFVACTAGADQARELRAQLAIEILPHPLSVLQRFLAGSLGAAKWHATSPSTGEVRIAGEYGPVTFGILITTAGRPTRNTARFIGERGTMHLDFFHGFSTFERPSVSRTRKAARPFAVSTGMFAGAAANLARRAAAGEPAYPGLRDLVREFYRAIDLGEGSPISPDDVRDLSRAMELLSDLLS